MCCRAAATSARGRATTLAERMRALVTDLNVCSQQGPVRALRLHHRRGHGAHAVRRVAPADAGAGHGGEAARVRRDHHGERHGLGLQPVPHGGEPVHGLVHRRGGERGEAGGRRFRARGHVPDVPGVLREAARRARALGQARRGRAGRARWRRSIWASGPSAARTPCPAASSSWTCRRRSCRSPRPWARSTARRRPSSRARTTAWCCIAPAGLRRRRARGGRPVGGLRRW